MFRPRWYHCGYAGSSITQMDLQNLVLMCEAFAPKRHEIQDSQTGIGVVSSFRVKH